MRRSVAIFLMVFSSLFCLNTANAAPILWMIAEHNANVGLVVVDATGGGAVVIGDLNIFMQDIAFGSNGTLYGSDGASLYEIDITDATSTMLSSFDGGNSLAYNSNDGLLYGNGGNNLVTIDPVMNVETIVGAIGFAGAGDLAFHNGKLYMTTLTDLIEVDTITGAGTLIGALDGGFFPVITPGAEAFGLVSADGTLYGVSDTLIFEIDTATGAGLAVSDYAGQGVGFGGGLAFESIAAVPLPPALWLFGSGLLGLAGMTRRKKKV